MRARLVEEFNADTYLIESILNEEFDIRKIKNMLSEIGDKKSALINFIKKFNTTHNLNLKKYVGIIIISLYLITFAAENNKWKSNIDINKISSELSKKETIELKDIPETLNKYENIFKNPEQLSVSKIGIQLIKKHEGLKLKGYDIGDGKITIGYGHAEDKATSKYKIGQRITKKEALQLFKEDIIQKDKDIQRMFRQWKERGRHVQITQNMYDALVSMAFNMGTSGLRNTELIEDVERGDFLAAAKKIKTTKISDKFPGLKERRKKEFELFSKDIS